MSEHEVNDYKYRADDAAVHGIHDSCRTESLRIPFVDWYELDIFAKCFLIDHFGIVLGPVTNNFWF